VPAVYLTRSNQCAVKTIRKADHLKIAQRFIAGITRVSGIKSPRSGRMKLYLESPLVTFSRPLSGLKISLSLITQPRRIGTGLFSGRPLCGLSARRR
jgi:hypothetical protein